MDATTVLRNELDQVKVENPLIAELQNAWKKYTKTPKRFVATPPPFVLDESLFPIEQENQLIDYFYRYYTDNPKKIVTWVNRIWSSVPVFMQRSLLKNILEDKNPAVYLLKVFAEQVRWGEIRERLIAEGNHGVIYTDKEVWGFKVDTLPNWLRESDKWNLDEQTVIMKKSYYKWARERGLKHFEGKVMLFHQFGFNGMSYYFNHPIDDQEGY